MDLQANTLDRLSPLPHDPSSPLQPPSRTLKYKNTKILARQRSPLDQSWHPSSSRPDPPPHLTFHGSASVSGDHLSPLEDDASIAPLRGAATEVSHSTSKSACSVLLVKTEALRIAPWGTAISASLAGKDSISLRIAIMLHNGHTRGKRGVIASRILDPAGESLGEIATPFHIFGLDRRSCDQALTIAGSALVSLGTHRIISSVLLEGRVVDECETTFDMVSALTGSVPKCSLLTERGTS